MIGSTARLVDLCRRRGTVIARTSAAAGLSLTLAGALAPAGAHVAGAATAGRGVGQDLRSLLNPSGVETHADPAEEMSAQQSFAAKHFAGAGLSAPLAT